jgi:hypothetical protein
MGMAASRLVAVFGSLVLLAGCFGAHQVSPDNVQTVGGLTPSVEDRDAGLVGLAPGLNIKAYKVIAVDKFPVADPALKDDGDRRNAAEMSTILQTEPGASSQHPDQWTTAIFTGFALLSLPLIADDFLARHEVCEEGLSYSRLTGRRGYLKWSEPRRVRYAPAMKWFGLETASGDVARISAMLVGLPEFASLLLAHAPSQAIEADTSPILRATAAGQPPPVWN